MPGYEFHLSHIFAYNDRIVDSVLIQKYTDQKKKLILAFQAVATMYVIKNISVLIVFLKLERFPPTVNMI